MARLAGVSKKTVSRVINRSALLSEDTRTKVEAVIQQLGYVPNPQARALALRRNFLLGLLHDNPNAQTVLKVQEGVLDAIRDTEFALVVRPVDRHSPTLLDDADHMVASNDREVLAQAVDHLVEFGHRRIALIEGPDGFRSAHERREGFLGAMQAHGLDVPDAARAQGTYRFESGIAAASQLLDAAERPTAIFASNDEMASGAFHAARQRNLRVPDDLSIIGFDDSLIAAHIWPPMATVGWPVREMGRAAALKLIAPDDDSAGEHRFPATLVKRQSIAPPRV